MYEYTLCSLEVVYSYEILNKVLGETEALVSSLMRHPKRWGFSCFVFVFIFNKRDNYLLDR